MALSLNPAATEDTLNAVMQDLKIDLPHDYKEFLGASNGGEGLLGQNYVSLWKAEELGRRNTSYNVASFAPRPLSLW